MSDKTRKRTLHSARWSKGISLFLRYKKDCVVLITLQKYYIFLRHAIPFYMFCNMFLHKNAENACYIACFCLLDNKICFIA